MTCPRCDHPNAAARRFCGGCGASLELACARCAFVNDAVDRFCGGCGDATASGADGRVVASPAVTPGITMLSAEALRALLAEIAPAAYESGTLPEGAIDQDDLDRVFGGAP